MIDWVSVEELDWSADFKEQQSVPYTSDVQQTVRGHNALGWD